jgi:hypothetical protein
VVPFCLVLNHTAVKVQASEKPYQRKSKLFFFYSGAMHTDKNRKTVPEIQVRPSNVEAVSHMSSLSSSVLRNDPSYPSRRSIRCEYNRLDLNASHESPPHDFQVYETIQGIFSALKAGQYTLGIRMCGEVCTEPDSLRSS